MRVGGHRPEPGASFGQKVTGARVAARGGAGPTGHTRLWRRMMTRVAPPARRRDPAHVRADTDRLRPQQLSGVAGCRRTALAFSSSTCLNERTARRSGFRTLESTSTAEAARRRTAGRPHTTLREPTFPSLGLIDRPQFASTCAT